MRFLDLAAMLVIKTASQMRSPNLVHTAPFRRLTHTLEERMSYSMCYCYNTRRVCLEAAPAPMLRESFVRIVRLSSAYTISRIRAAR
jgi:hypothetical protein